MGKHSGLFVSVTRIDNRSFITQRAQSYLPGHFVGEVLIEGVRSVGQNAEVRVRLSSGELDEAFLTENEIRVLLDTPQGSVVNNTAVDAEKLRLLVESTRIRLAYAFDKQFAVSLSGIRTLPHQIEAVYMRMLPQPRLRFLLADDPGAGKTIMAGLLIKELLLREAIERVLILVPAPLTIQWQDELLRFFGESFQVIHSGNDQQQLINLWQRETKVIASLDYAKQDDVRERVWQQHWDLVIIDEAHKCSAYTKSTTGGRGRGTRRYQLAERLSDECDLLLLLTATPHHGDDDRVISSACWTKCSRNRTNSGKKRARCERRFCMAGLSLGAPPTQGRSSRHLGKRLFRTVMPTVLSA